MAGYCHPSSIILCEISFPIIGNLRADPRKQNLQDDSKFDDLFVIRSPKFWFFEFWIKSNRSASSG